MNDFILGQWTVSPTTHQISCDSITLQLRPLQMQLLCLLVEHQGVTLSRETILEQIWPGRYGADEALSRTMSELRKALGDSVEIQTVPKAGYCLFTKPVTHSPQHEVEVVDVKDEQIVRPERRKVKKTKWKITFAIGLLSILVISLFYLNHKPQSVHESVSVAILPLNNFTDSTRNGLLADGLVEEITHQLARHPKISVASRTSAFFFRDSPLPAMEIGEKLSVSHILEGSIRLTTKGYRITAQLIETVTGFHIWSNTFDSEENGLLEVQEQIAAEVRKLVGQSLAPQKAEISNELFETYLLGVEAIAEFGPANLKVGEEYFKTVLAAHPNYTPAKVGLATSIIAQLNWGQINENIGFLTAENLLNEVSASEELTADYYLARALLYSPKAIARKNTNIEVARQWYEKALKQAPNNSRILSLYATYAAKSREHAIELTKKALQFDPYNALLVYDAVVKEVPWSRTDLMLVRAKEMIEQFPKSVHGYFLASRSYDIRNNYLQSYIHSYRCVEAQPQFMDCWAILIASLVAAELYEEAIDVTDIANGYVPSVITEFAVLKKAIEGDANKISQLMQEVEVERLNPVLSHTALIWAMSQLPLKTLTEKQKLQYKQMAAFTPWQKQLYQYHWQRYKDQDFSFTEELSGLIEEIKSNIEINGTGHRWLMAALAMNDQVDEAFEYANTIPANHSVANFFRHFHQSILDPFLQPLHDDPRWEKWVATHAATQKDIREQILAIQKDLPLSGLIP